MNAKKGMNVGSSQNAENILNTAIDKSKVFVVVEVINYEPNSVVIKTIMKKTTGNISVASFDTGEAMIEKTSPFDTLIQVIDGMAEIVIENQSHLLNIGQSIIVPAHSRNTIKANERFKMISTIIKSGYDEVYLGSVENI